MQMAASTDSLGQAAKTIEPILWWPEISDTITLVALILGFLVIIISYFAGARENSNKIFFSIILATAITLLSMPLLIYAMSWVLDSSQSLWGTIFVIVVAVIFAATVAVHAYEIVVVSAREARPPD
jgi:hypothetical protein